MSAYKNFTQASTVSSREYSVSQAIERVALGDRSVHAERLAHKGNILHGHSNACQGSGPSGHVGHLSRLQRRVSPCTYPPRHMCTFVGDKRLKNLVLPFGLNTAPWVFIKVVKQIRVCSVVKLRVLFQYLDDRFDLFKGYDKALCGTKELQGVCTTLGLLINQNAIYSLPRRVPGLHWGKGFSDAGPPRSGIFVTESGPLTD